MECGQDGEFDASMFMEPRIRPTLVASGIQHIDNRDGRAKAILAVDRTANIAMSLSTRLSPAGEEAEDPWGLAVYYVVPTDGPLGDATPKCEGSAAAGRADTHTRELWTRFGGGTDGRDECG